MIVDGRKIKRKQTIKIRMAAKDKSTDSSKHKKMAKARNDLGTANQEERVRNKSKKERITCSRGTSCLPLPSFLPYLPELAHAISLAFSSFASFSRASLSICICYFVYPVLSISTCLLNLKY